MREPQDESRPVITGIGADQTSPDGIRACQDVTPDVVCETAPDDVSATTGKSLAWVESMLIHRHGALPDSYMTAIGLHRLVTRGATYRVSTRKGLIPAPHNQSARDLESEVNAQTHHAPPDHVTVAAVWDTSTVVEGDQENMLGDNVIFQMLSHATAIDVPLVEASHAHLGYYGATLVADGAVVRFPNHQYPIWKMALGTTYVDGFIMTRQGKGFYLEYHHDRPHWHQPLTADCGGYYLLAKQAGSDAAGTTRFHVTGFTIPYGKAVYTSQGAMHCDAALTGKNWLVGYADSDHFSTALVRNAQGNLVKITATKR